MIIVIISNNYNSNNNNSVYIYIYIHSIYIHDRQSVHPNAVEIGRVLDGDPTCQWSRQTSAVRVLGRRKPHDINDR